MENKTVRNAIEQLNKECIDFLPNKDRDILTILEYILELNETGILSNLDLQLSTKQLTTVSEVIKRVKKDEPIEYITNTGYFYGNRFKVTKNTLIPRPETEVLVDLALSELNKMIYDPNSSRKDRNIIDIGTGTGCIPIAISLNTKEKISIKAVDISTKAIEVAKENIQNSNQSKRITTHLSDLFEEISKDEKFDIILANLPYISTKKMKNLPNSVKDYEPKIALDGGKGGSELVLKFLDQAKNRLKNKGVIILEVDPEHIDSIKRSSKKLFPKAKITKINDLYEKERFIMINT